MEVQLLQTSDPHRYFDLFTVTSIPTRRFCELQGVKYTGYIGLSVGYFPWHATYNRIPLLAGMLRDGYRGWVIYLDADAYVSDVTFDIHAFLNQHSGKSILGAPGGEQSWNINAGILFINLGQAAGQRIVAEWAEGFYNEVGNERLRSAKNPWQDGLKDDQVLLHQVLGREDTSTVLEKLPLEFVGWPESRFVRQLLRTHGSLEERIALARAGVEKIPLPAVPQR